jgi:hypothetical protein
MTQRRPQSREALEDALAEAVWGLSASQVPDACTRIGLRSGTRDEAMGSKRKYARARTKDMQLPELLSAAQKFLDDFEAPALEDTVLELTTTDDRRISQLTRQAVLEALVPIRPLFGKLNPIHALDALKPDWNESSSLDPLTSNLQGDIEAHFVNGSGFDSTTALKMCGVLTCYQNRFFALLGELVSPLARDARQQLEIVGLLNPILAVDGYTLKSVDQVSGRSVYEVRRLASGVSGAVKNLIFASVRVKPDIVLRDALNNDVEIVNESDALVYDRELTETGLSWGELTDWWTSIPGIVPDHLNASQALYARLQATVRASRSPGEYALFRTYFSHFASLRDTGDLPALVPQVFLHYDPRTLLQRGESLVFARQRMDMLLLLNHSTRIILEVDGKHHYADDGRASPKKYAVMASEDRRLRLLGYEVYRFGAAEFSDTVERGRAWDVGPQSTAAAVDFFESLFAKHPIKRR